MVFLIESEELFHVAKYLIPRWLLRFPPLNSSRSRFGNQTSLLNGDYHDRLRSFMLRFFQSLFHFDITRFNFRRLTAFKVIEILIINIRIREESIIWHHIVRIFMWCTMLHMSYLIIYDGGGDFKFETRLAPQRGFTHSSWQSPNKMIIYV